MFGFDLTLTLYRASVTLCYIGWKVEKGELDQKQVQLTLLLSALFRTWSIKISPAQTQTDYAAVSSDINHYVNSVHW